MSVASGAPRSPLRVFGVDPGTHALGYGVIEVRHGVAHHVAHGTVRALATHPLPQRLATIRSALAQAIAELAPHVVAIEGLFYARNVKSALTLAHGRGVALEVAASCGLPVVEYSPMEMKRGLVGYGRATKLQVAKMVQRLLALPSTPSADAADALAIAICHAHADRLSALRSRRGRLER